MLFDFSFLGVFSPPSSPPPQILNVLQNWIVEAFDLPTFFGMRFPEDEVCNLQDTQRVT